MSAKHIAVAGIVALALLGCAEKRPVEPSEQTLLKGIAECQKAVCKEFKKKSCQRVMIDPAVPNQDLFKCEYSYVPAGAASAKSETKCFNADGSVSAPGC